MTTRDEFTEQDFAELRRHPVVAPMLAKLVWVTADGTTCLLMQGADGIDAGLASPGALGPLRIAHPVDFVADGSWVHWQERLFALGWRQPFKQVFRELYVRTEQELTDSPVSHRYDGHQVQARPDCTGHFLPPELHGFGVERPGDHAYPRGYRDRRLLPHDLRHTGAFVVRNLCREWRPSSPQ